MLAKAVSICYNGCVPYEKGYIMKYLILIPVVMLTACGTPKIPGYAGPHALDRDGVIMGARSCVNTRMKPNVVYLPQKTEFGSVLVPVDVQCDPYK